MSGELRGVAGGIAAEGAELVHGAEGGALVCGGLALEIGEGAGGVAAVGLDEHVVGVGAAAVGGHTLDHFYFEALGAGDQPLRTDNLLDEEALVGGGGADLFQVEFEELIEILLAFGVEDAEAAGEAVGGGVGGGARLAFGGTGAGAELRVAAVGFDL